MTETEDFEAHGMHIEEVPVEAIPEIPTEGSGFQRFAEQATRELGRKDLDYGKVAQELMAKGVMPGTGAFVRGILDALHIEDDKARDFIVNGLMSDARERSDESRPEMEEALGKIADHENPDK